MPTVKADLGACQGYANCVAAADQYFDIDDDGVVVQLTTDVAESDRARSNSLRDRTTSMRRGTT